ncbi:MAG: bifunctional nucleoside/nucleotide kinase/histidine phosphatase family protein [Nanobdellota archaeon]
MDKLCIAMVGLPAMGKSTLARKLEEQLNKEKIKTLVFNNGQVRRDITQNTYHHDFYNPNNTKGKQIREKIAMNNIVEAKKFLTQGNVAILDATNVSHQRRRTIEKEFKDIPLLFVECINGDRELVSQSISQKIKLSEFRHLDCDEAYKSFEKRINYYRKIYSRLEDEDNFLVLDSLNNRIIRERYKDKIPYFGLLRDLFVSDCVKNLFLIRHGETKYNSQNRIGGDSDLTDKGKLQAEKISEYFSSIQVPYIFTSFKKRAESASRIIKQKQKSCKIINFDEFNEINAGICENMTYEEIMRDMPEIFEARKADKYNYVYPEGESYRIMYDRVKRGIKRAIFLAGNSSTFMIVGHRAVNRIILSYFLYRRKEDIPYAYIPQDKFFHITSTHNKKHLELKSFYF